MRLILDTSVLIGGQFEADSDIAVASISYGELEYGVEAAADPEHRALRRDRLDRLHARFGQGLPFDDGAAHSYGLLAGLVRASGRNPRSRAADLMIAAVAHANDAAIATRNPDDLRGIERLVSVIDAR